MTHPKDSLGKQVKISGWIYTRKVRAYRTYVYPDRICTPPFIFFEVLVWNVFWFEWINWYRVKEVFYGPVYYKKGELK